MNRKEIQNNCGRLATQMEDMLAKTEREGRTGFTSAERQRYEALTLDYDKQEALLRQGDGNDTGMLDRLPNGPGARISNIDMEEMRETYRLSSHQLRNRTPHDRAFTNYLRNSEGALSQDDLSLVRNGGGRGGGFRNVTSTTTGSQGGYVVPVGFSKMLEQAMKWYGGIDGVVETFTTETGAPLPWPTNDDTMNVGRIIGQNVQMTETDPTFNQVTFNAWIFSSDITLIPRALIEDSYFDLDALLAQMLGRRIGRLLNNKCTVGSGSGEPNGLVTAVVAAGNTMQLSAGNTGSIAYSNLVDLQHMVDPAYRDEPSSRFMFNDMMLKLLKKLVDGNNRPLWQPGLSASFRDGAPVDFLNARPTVLSSQYIVNQDMATPGASNFSMLFGDMSKYKLRKVGDIQVQRLVERYADYLQIGFLGWLRADGQLVDASATTSLSPIAALQQSAS